MFIGRIIILPEKSVMLQLKNKKKKKCAYLPSCVVRTCSRRLLLWKSLLAAVEKSRFYRITISHEE